MALTLSSLCSLKRLFLDCYLPFYLIYFFCCYYGVGLVRGFLNGFLFWPLGRERLFRYPDQSPRSTSTHATHLLCRCTFRLSAFILLSLDPPDFFLQAVNCFPGTDFEQSILSLPICEVSFIKSGTFCVLQVVQAVRIKYGN